MSNETGADPGSRPAGKICPPPPPKIGPLCLVERDKDSDLSSVSDLEEDFDFDVSKTASQKFEEVSENELELSEDDPQHQHQRQQTPLRGDLETIESDENDQTSLSSISDNEEFLEWDQNHCDICQLVFKSAEAQEKHSTSEGHLQQAKRDSEQNSPSSFCRLCSKEFKGVASTFSDKLKSTSSIKMMVRMFRETLQELQQHEDGEEHQEEMNAQQVLSCNVRLPLNGRPPKRKSVSQYTSPQKKIALGKYRSSPERVDDSLACYLCNLVFVSHAFQQKHLSSENHRKNLKSLKPPVCESWYSYFSTGSHYCYSCWIGYNNVKDLIKHYTRPSHLDLLKSLGISRIYLDERYVHKSIWHSAEKFRHQTIDLKNFTVIDRAGVCDTSSETYDVGFMGQVKPASLSKSTAEALVADTEAVSSDETSDFSDSELDQLLSKPSNHLKGEVLASSQLDLQDVSD